MRRFQRGAFSRLKPNSRLSVESQPMDFQSIVVQSIVSKIWTFHNGYANRQMHMITTDDPLDDPNVEGITDLPNQVSAAHLDLSPEHAVSVLRAEDQMHLQLVNAMGALSLLHAQNLLKVSC